MRLTQRLSVFLLFLSVLPAMTAAQQPALNAIDFIELPSLSAPAMSPDGNLLLYRHSVTDWQENAVVQRLRLRNIKTGAFLPVAEPESAEESFSEGVWRPDGGGFALRLKREQDDHRQIYFFDHQRTDLKRLTTHGADVESVFWGADATVLYYTAKAVKNVDTARLEKDDWLIPRYDRHTHREIWRLHISSGATEPVVRGDFSVRSVSLTRDGSRLVYTRVPSHDLNDNSSADVWVTDLETGTHTRWTDNDFAEYDPVLSADGSALAYIATVNQKGEPYYEDNVFVLRQTDGKPEQILGDKALEMLSVAWDATSQGLFILGNSGLRTQLYHYQLSDGTLTQLTRGDHALSRWHYDATNNVHLARRDAANVPGDIVAIDSTSGDLATLTSEFADVSERFWLPRQEAVTWRGRGRTTIEGLLVYPRGYEAGERYPLVTVIHGGPRSSSQFGSWNRSRYVAVLAGQGYAVLLPNHRGGTGYGDAFMRDMYGQYFRNAHFDVLGGVDAMVKRGIANPDQLIAMGWSAGGHMVNKLITVDDRFAAASSGAGASDWLSMVGESDVRQPRTRVFGGLPWQRSAPLKNLRKNSTLQDAWRVTSPTLFFVGENDVRVPPTQSIMMYRGVRAAGVPTELYVADGQPHNYRKPSFQLFKINRELAWFAEHVLGTSYETILPTAATPAATATKDAP